MKRINLKNIKSFLEGNYKYYLGKLIAQPMYIQEQIQYRYSLCKKDCIPANACIYCKCPPIKKAFVTESCNEGKRFPDLMSNEKWQEFKVKNKINE